jgi:hypothetical protein
MKKSRNALIGTLAGMICIPLTTFGTQLTLVGLDGENVEVHLDTSEKFTDIMGNLKDYYNTDFEPIASPVTLQFVVAQDQIVVRKKDSGRNYSAPVSKSEKKDITYIVTTLARDSLVSVGLATSSLNKAGDRINNVHPLKFLMTIFADEELKACAHGIRDRGGFIWQGFLDGVIKGSSEETAKKNMKVEFIEDFAKKVKIDPALIIEPIQQSRWKDFVNLLLDKIPRSQDPNRYDM